MKREKARAYKQRIERLRDELRIKLLKMNKTQREVAEEFGESPHTVNQIMSDNIVYSMKAVERIHAKITSG